MGVEASFLPFESDNMHAVYREARQRQPVFFCEELDCYVVTRRDDIAAIFSDPESYSAVNSQSPIRVFSDRVSRILQEGGFTREPTQANTDAPKHTRIRDISSGFLNARQYAALRPDVVRLTRAALSALRGKNRIDFVKEVTYELPAKVLFLLLGAPEADAFKIKLWADNRFNMVWGVLDEETEVAAAHALVDYWNYCKALVAARVQTPGLDYASYLIAARNGDDSVLTMNEICSLIHGVMLAGHETTTNAAGGLLLSLMQNPDQWRTLVNNPKLIPNAVEEGLRYTPPLITWRRRAKCDTTIAGIDIPAGANILMSIVSANRDEDEFFDGERFDIARENARRHLAFGKGIHFCLGAQLAKLELTVLLEELVATYPAMSLVPDQQIDWPYNMGFRGPKSVWVDLDGVSAP
jgi:cytochrome P450